jgi:hypothetical protein
VGSEMCIRDRVELVRIPKGLQQMIGERATP